MTVKWRVNVFFIRNTLLHSQHLELSYHEVQRTISMDFIGYLASRLSILADCDLTLACRLQIPNHSIKLGVLVKLFCRQRRPKISFSETHY